MKKRPKIIGHFRVHLSLHFKTRLSAKSLLSKSVFIHIEIGTNYHNKNFALRLALKERLKGTWKWIIRKWPIRHEPPKPLYSLPPISRWTIFHTGSWEKCKKAKASSPYRLSYSRSICFVLILAACLTRRSLSMVPLESGISKYHQRAPLPKPERAQAVSSVL